jgi:hypothetical protein
VTVKQLDHDLVVKVQETPTLSIDGTTDPTVTHAIPTPGQMKPAGTTPAVSRVYRDQLVLVAGALTIDLTSLDQGNLPDINLTGLKVQALKMRALSTNTAPVLVSAAVSNGYEIFGAAAGGQVELGAGAQVAMIFNEHLADVAAGIKDLTFASTDLDAVIDVLVVAG